METIGDRIKSERKEKKLTQEELGKLVGVGKSSVSQWESGLTKNLIGHNLTKVAMALGVNENWIVTGQGVKQRNTSNAPRLGLQTDSTLPGLQGYVAIDSNAEYLGGFDEWDDETPLRDDEVALPYLREVELAAGSGKYEVIDNGGRKLRFAKSTLRNKGVTKEYAYCVTVAGNSMEPVLPDGSTVGVDTSNTTIKNGDMYAIDHDGHLRIKRLYQLPGGVLRVRSFNDDEWPDEHYSGDELAKIRVLGRVFWSSALW